MSKLEQAFKQFHDVHTSITRDGAALSIVKLTREIEEGLGTLAEGIAEKPVSVVNLSEGSKIAVRADLWVRVWTAAITCEPVTCTEASNFADSCLKNFDERFPEYKTMEGKIDHA